MLAFNISVWISSASTWPLRRGVIVSHEAEEVDVIHEIVEVLGVEEALLILVVHDRWNDQDEQLVRLSDLAGNRLDLKHFSP